MKPAQLLILALVLLTLACFLPSAAQAQCWGGFAYGDGYYPGWGYGRNLYAIGNVPIPPYFSLHPPVYYGDRIYRTYGWSPFAYPPYGPRPEADVRYAAMGHVASKRPEAKPKLVLNPHIKPQVAQTPSDPQPTPKWVVNPFYEGPEVQLANARQ